MDDYLEELLERQSPQDEFEDEEDFVDDVVEV